MYTRVEKSININNKSHVSHYWRNVTNKEREKARMNPAVLDWNQKYQNKLSFYFIPRDIYRNK